MRIGGIMRREVEMKIATIKKLRFLKGSEFWEKEYMKHCDAEEIARILKVKLNMCSGVSRISFRGGFKIFLEKWGYLHSAKRHAARGEATRLLGGFGGMLPRENF